MVSSSSPYTTSLKHEGVPVWHATPVCSTRTSSVSASQSVWIDLIFCTWPDSSPFFHIFCLDLDQKCV